MIGEKKKGGCLRTLAIGFALFMVFGTLSGLYHGYKLKSDPEYAAAYAEKEKTKELARQEREKQREIDRIESERIAYWRQIEADRQKAKNDRTAAENTRRAQRWGERPQSSGWDGKVYAVEKYLKSSAKDPKSIAFYGWSDILYNENSGWVVQCDWGARNSFGGMVREVNWFVIQHGKVIQMLPSDSFRPQ